MAWSLGLLGLGLGLELCKGLGWGWAELVAWLDQERGLGKVYNRAMQNSAHGLGQGLG